MNKRQQVGVVAAIVDGGRILIIRRHAKSRYEAGKWGFPGGAIEFGESPEEALKREMREELQADVEVGELLSVDSKMFERDDEEKHVILLVYLARLKSEPKANKEHIDDMEWATPEGVFSHELIKRDDITFKKVFRILELKEG